MNATCELSHTHSTLIENGFDKLPDMKVLFSHVSAY